MELLNTIRPIYSLFTLATRVQSLAKVLPTIPHVGIAIPTWLRGLRLGGGRCGAGSVLSSALWEETPPGRELHAQLLCHLHVVPRVDIVKDATACQLHLEGEEKGWERKVSTALLFSNSAPLWLRSGAEKETDADPSNNPSSESSSLNAEGFFELKDFFLCVCVWGVRIYLAIV